MDIIRGKLLKKMQSVLTGKLVMVLLFLANAVYLLMLFYSIPKLIQYSGGLELFDMSPFGYSYQTAMALLLALGENGRHFYQSTQLVLDLFYPLLFALAYSSLALWLAKGCKRNCKVMLYLAVVPIFVCLFDYLENISIWVMLSDFPAVSDGLVATSSLFTVVKSSLTMFYFSGLILALGKIAVDWGLLKLKG